MAMTQTQEPLLTFDDFVLELPPKTQHRAGPFLRRAYEFVLTAHQTQRRESGELYVEHDLAVAQILGQLGVDANTVVAGILHDCLSPHTGKVEKDLQTLFEAEVVELVTGLNHLFAYAERPSYKKQWEKNKTDQTLETIRRAILSIIEGDIRVILIRLADCLHDLRQAEHLLPSRQMEIATEAMNIFAPLANRLGVWQMKWELEDLAFRYLLPEQYNDILRHLALQRDERAHQVSESVKKLRQKIQEVNIRGEVTGRPKHIYSIYRKMERKRVGFEHIYDVQALRVIIDPTDTAAYDKKSSKEKDNEDRSLCYQVLGLVHGMWQPIPKEFDDYIAAPKANGYKSLHTAVIDPETGQTFEVQIRTRRMHEEAEKGVAAHWAYKEDGLNSKVSQSAHKRIQELRESLATLRDSESATSEEEIFESEVVAERIYVYTPKGDVMDLPLGSTPIDFAYQIHTNVGHRCRGARVNGKMVGLDYKLRSGDRVEIVTIGRPGPSRDWMNASLGYTGSARTRGKIRQWFRLQERAQNIEQGREMVEKELKRLGLWETFKIEDIARALHYEDLDEFLARVGFGDVQSNQISGAISLLRQSLKTDDVLELRPLLQPQEKPRGLSVMGASGLYTRMAGCCNPIAPEPIIGFITRGQGITIHSKECKQVQSISEPERMIEVTWGLEPENTYPISIVVTAYRRSTLLDDMIRLFRGRQINVPKTKTVTHDNIMTIHVVAEVRNMEELHWLLSKLENLPNVIEARRQRWA